NISIHVSLYKTIYLSFFFTDTSTPKIYTLSLHTLFRSWKKTSPKLPEPHLASTFHRRNFAHTFARLAVFPRSVPQPTKFAGRSSGAKRIRHRLCRRCA